MNKNIMIVMGGALVFAVLVAMLVQFALGGKKTEEVKVAEAPLEILVAAKDLKIGAELVEGDLRWQQWPEGSMFSGAIRRKDGQTPNEALEGRLARNLSAGEPVLKSALIQSTKGNFVAGSLEPGQRAVAIEVKASTMAGGFVGPGDYVDVILTYRGQMYAINEDDVLAESVISRNLDKLATETILQNVRVLAVDQLAERPEDDEKIKVGKTVTVAVTAQQAEKLSLAREMGDITLALRGVGDNVHVAKEWQTISDTRLMQVDDEIVEEYQKIRNETGISGDIMRIYSGNQMSAIQSR